MPAASGNSAQYRILRESSLAASASRSSSLMLPLASARMAIRVRDPKPFVLVRISRAVPRCSGSKLELMADCTCSADSISQISGQSANVMFPGFTSERKIPCRRNSAMICFTIGQRSSNISLRDRSCSSSISGSKSNSGPSTPALAKSTTYGFVTISISMMSNPSCRRSGLGTQKPQTFVTSFCFSLA